MTELRDMTGKRTTKRNAYGNLVGYVGGKRWDNLNGMDVEPYSDAEKRVQAAFLAGHNDPTSVAWDA